MIKANELRVGNWVNDEGTYDQIGISHFGKSIDFPIFEDLKPIPLTPEILEKAGFVDGFFQDAIEYRDKDKTLRLWGPDGCNDGHNFAIENVEHLHQLQNIIYFTTGSELEINL